ncbi:ImmA/IrrE family metallo-endopeptidase [Kitasatospora sp. NPDC048239]|uniref:ImmA/IrrE family metallo-endopeptidase n=1 Tax=Kitasatospora sp. NPDC048239 TaxID=3364046 RepID=UPI003711A94B
MTHETAALDGPALSRLLSNNNVTHSMLEQLFGSPDVGDELMRGVRRPSLYEATLLGSLMDVDPSVLTGARKPPIGVSLRLGTADVGHDVQVWVEHAAKLLAADRLTEEWGFSTPPVDLSTLSISKNKWDAKESGRKTAERLRSYLGLGIFEPVKKLTDFIESLGHPVEYAPLPTGVHGISVPEEHQNRKRWVVLINCNDYWARQRFSLAHELSHVLYQDAGQVIVDRTEPPELRPEIIADSFARHFLLPEEALHLMIGRHEPTSLTAVQRLMADIVITYGISRQAALKALKETRAATVDRSLLEACEQIPVASMMAFAGSGPDWSELEQDRGRPFASPRLTDQVLDGFADGVVSLETVSNVIAGGNSEKAAQMLREAGWNLPAVPGTPESHSRPGV